MDYVECVPAEPPKSGLSRHLVWLNRQPMLVFTLLMAVYGFVARIIPLAAIIALERTGTSIPTTDWRPRVFLQLVGAPLLETFIGQWFPFWVTARFTRSPAIQIGVSTVFFGLCHLPNVAQVLVVFPACFALAYTYYVWRSRGRHKGYWATALCHFWLNGIATILQLLLWPYIQPIE